MTVATIPAPTIRDGGKKPVLLTVDAILQFVLNTHHQAAAGVKSDYLFRCCGLLKIANPGVFGW
jgi:hypothetical protein